MSGKAFKVDAAKCTSCNLCVIACKDEHTGSAHLPWTEKQPDTGHFWVDIVSREGGQTPRVSVINMPMFCQHCDDAPCIKACPEDAISKRQDGLVTIDPETCNGCRLCQDACPYDVIYYNEVLDVAQKCTGCAHRVDEGLEPRCAEICPHEAIQFVEVDSIDDELKDGSLDVLHPEFFAQPRVLWAGLPKASISGRVIDATGEEVAAGVEVRVTDLFTDASATVRTDVWGEFRATGLEDGHKYLIAIVHEGAEASVQVAQAEFGTDIGVINLPT